MRGWEFKSRLPTHTGGGVSGRPHREGHPPASMHVRIQDQNSPVKINV